VLALPKGKEKHINIKGSEKGHIHTRDVGENIPIA